MDRTNLTTTAARTRIKNFINNRCRDIQTSANMNRVRFGTVTINTVLNTPETTVTTIIKPVTITLPALNRVLGERTLDQILAFNPANTWTGAPEVYAIKNVLASGVTFRWAPIPDGVYALVINGILPGTDMVADADVPGFPADFHDSLIYGALSDEYDHMDQGDMSMKQEQKYQKRLGDLRYWIQKSIYLHRVQNGTTMNWNWWEFYGSPWVN